MKLEKGHIPLYYQTEQILREKISSGEITHDRPISTEAALCKEYGVSRITVRQAFASLTNDGLVRRIPRKGTCLSQGNPREGIVHYFSDIDGLVQLASKANNRITYRQLTLPTKKIASLLNLNSGQKAFRIRGIRSLKDLPMCYFIIHLPSEFAHSLAGESLRRGAILTILEQNSGVPAQKVRRVISASRADGRTARFLGLKEGSRCFNLKGFIMLPTEEPSR
ncbi:MAG: GntR family transcriptional regulator [Desulfatiglans sp.]|jgi:GntR family transcriptional regulator|nr:GntR family transcriptional regulator [Thermodesulfobacteriota bacterium]MEE4353550.1 GntR family transcriptional regulator [Desulfatiglans sp.]